MKSKKTLLLILLILASWIPEARAITPQNQTVKITDTHDDMFITEVGIGIDSSLVTIKDPNMDIRSFLVFRELDINYWEPLENATLRLHTSSTLDFDADSSITIYGMALSDLQLEGFLLPSTVLSLGYTSANTVFNTSQFYGQTWHEIDITDIIEELIRNPNWDGDGASGAETGDAVGLHIVGAEGDDQRYFYDYSVGNGLEAQLVLHWNHEPPPPAGTGDLCTFNETYRGYHIWHQLSEWLNYTSFTLVNPDANIQNLNDTYFEYTTFFEDDDDYLRKSFSGSGQINRRFGITYNVFKENTGTESSGIILHWGLANKTASPWGPPYWGEGYSIATIQAAGGATREKLELTSWVNGAHHTHVELHGYWNDADLPATIWVDVNLNLDTGAYNVTVYNDPEMTDVNTTDAGTFGAVPDASLFTTEFAIGPTQSGSAFRDWESGLRHSIQDVPESWTLTDENGTTVISGLLDHEDAIIYIDDILGPDPEDPDPEGQEWEETGAFTRFRTRFYILILGFGMFFGPLFVFAAKRPTGYEFVIGLFIMFVGISLMIAAGSV